MVLMETSFPRGGVVKKQEEPKQIVFGARQDKKEKKRKPKKPKDDNEVHDNVEKQADDIEAFSADLLSHKTIQEGMLIMGCVTKIDPIYLEISLPGRMMGKVVASNISDSYTEMLNKYVDSNETIENFRPLTEMYRVGQVVYVKVLALTEENGKLEINLSLKPSDVHSNMHHERICKGVVFNGAVKELQEHGYVIETGVKDLRCFLPSEKSSEIYTVGQLVFLRVESITHTPNASTAICKALNNENKKIKDINEPNLYYIFPSTIVRFTVSKVLRSGLQGTIMNGTFKAYINEHQLADPLANPKDFEINSVVSARLLYVMPLTKLVYLSLNLNLVPDDKKLYQVGDIVQSAKVLRLGTGGIILNLDNKAKGLISFFTIKANYTGNYDPDEMLAKYAHNTDLKVRVVKYDQMDSLYICNDNPSVVNQQFYTVNDLKASDFVLATIFGKDPTGGYFVRVGRVKGLIERIYLAPTSLNLHENAKLRCRVLSTASHVSLTNRVEYMATDCRLLTDISQAKQKKVFVGTIVKVDPKFLLVKFCNDIKGILYKSTITGHMANEMSSFYEGQTMPFQIIRRDEEKILLGLVQEGYKVGEICRAKVNSIIDNGLDITIDDDHHMKGLVPTRLLSDFPELVEAHLNTMKIGNYLEVACIVKNIFSIRDVSYFRDNPAKSWKSVKPGDILRGYVKNVEGDIVEIFLPIQDFNQLVKVHMKMFLQTVIKNPNIVVYPDQVIYVKVVSIEAVTRNITISAKLEDVWDCDLKTTADICASYIDELKRIKGSLISQGNPLGNIDMGEMVQAKLVDCDKKSNDWTLELPTGVRGIIKSTFTQGKQGVVGTSVNCVVLWIDYLNGAVYLSHKGSELNRIVQFTELPQKFGKGVVGFNGKVVLKTRDFIVCSLKKEKNPLFFVPTRLHYNDFEELIGSGIEEGQYCRLASLHDKYPIAVFEDTWRTWTFKNNNKKRKQSNDTEAVVVKKGKVSTSMQKFTPLVIQGCPISEDDTDLLSDDEDGYKEIIEEYEKELDKLNVLSKEKSRKRNHSESRTTSAKGSNGNTKKKAVSSNDDVKPLKKEDNYGKYMEQMVKAALKYKAENKQDPIKPALPGAATAVSSDHDVKPLKKEDNYGKYMEQMVKAALKYKTENKQDPIKPALPGEVKKEDTYGKYMEQMVKAAHDPIKPALPGASGFWSNDLQTLSRPSENIAIEESSDDDENANTPTESKKKKKLTASERFRAAREEEARLREIEDRLANPNIQPESADQFDRLVLANPNSSKTWIEYMAFHLTATEIDKARTVARKALKAINFREEQELLNIWVALLNLELRYGTKESFNDVLKESLICNDPFEVYMRVIQILTDSQKVQELTEMVTTVTKKFKDKTETWKIAANAYFEVGLNEKAKQLLHKALVVLPERDHINTIVSFANINHKHSDKETAHALLEQVLSSYPKRVDVWSRYVDMLIKDEEIESARRTLERAIIQKIPLKKMRILFKKYIEFEERYGTEENVEKVREIAANYVKKEINS